MSVTTTFDENIRDARENIKTAYVLINEALNEDTWGYCDMNDRYIEKLEGIRTILSQMIRNL